MASSGLLARAMCRSMQQLPDVSGRLCAGVPGPRHPDLEAAALGSAALVFFAQRASSPRDLSAAACSELRHACFEVLKDMY